MSDFDLYTPTWTTPRGCPQPLLMNGTIQGWLGRDWGAIMFRVGSVTSFGTGPWLFTCPVPEMSEGLALIKQQSTSVAWPARGIVTDGLLRLWADPDQAPVTATHPLLWQPGDTLRATAGSVPEDFRWTSTPTLRP